MGINWSKVVSVAEKGVRVVERTGFAAFATYVTQAAVPSLFSGSFNAQAWKGVLVAGFFAAVHAEVGALVTWLRGKFPKAAPVVQQAAQAVANAAGGDGAS